MNASLPIGSAFANYVIDAVIARGGMGVVYRATQQQPRRRIALKLIAPEHAGNPAYRERFLREADLLASMEHPNIVPIYDAGEFDGQLYLAMRYIDGPDLGTILVRNGPLTLARTIDLLAPVANALDAAHETGLVHRDVKPANILLDNRGAVYLTDFGLTKKTRSNSGLTAVGQAIGTPGYMAPEQLTGEKTDPALAPRIDVYALGCVLHACLTGEEPYVRDSYEQALFAHVYSPPPQLSTRRPELPAALDDVLARSLAKSPTERHESAGAFVAAVREAAHSTVDQSAGHRPTAPTPPPPVDDATQLIATPVERSSDPVPPPPAERRPIPAPVVQPQPPMTPPPMTPPPMTPPPTPPTPQPAPGRGDLPTVVAPLAGGTPPIPGGPGAGAPGTWDPGRAAPPAGPPLGSGGATGPAGGRGSQIGPAVGVALVAVAGLVAILWFGGIIRLPGGTAAASPTPTTRPSATPRPTAEPTASPTPTPTPEPEERFGTEADQATLLALVPDGVRGSCVASQILGEGGIAAVICERANVSSIWYELYPDVASLQTEYEEVRVAAGVDSDTGTCSAGEESEGLWNFEASADVDRGRLLCSVYQSRAWIDFTFEEASILTTIRGTNEDISALYGEWAVGDIHPLPAP